MSRAKITIELEAEDGVGTHAWVRMTRRDSDTMGEMWVDSFDENACIACVLNYLLDGLKGEIHEQAGGES